MEQPDVTFEKFLKMNSIITAFPDDVNPTVKDQLIERAEKDGYEVFSKITVGGQPTWLISKEELSSFQKKRMASIMEEYIKSIMSSIGEGNES